MSLEKALLRMCVRLFRTLDFGEQVVPLRSVHAATTAMAVGVRLVVFLSARESGLGAGRGGLGGFNGGFGFGQMPLADGPTVEGVDAFARVIGLGLGSEVVFDVLPVVASLVVGAESAARIVSAMPHAILAPSIAGHAVDHAIFGPIDVVQHLLVTRV